MATERQFNTTSTPATLLLGRFSTTNAFATGLGYKVRQEEIYIYINDKLYLYSTVHEQPINYATSR